MRFVHLTWKELWHRKVGTLLILAAIALCSGLIVAIQGRSIVAVEKNDRDMRGMGRNLVILPKGLGLDAYQKGEFGDATIPQTELGTVSKRGAGEEAPLPIRHFIGSLRRKVEIDGKKVILCGLTAEIDPVPPGGKKEPLERRLEAAEAELGFRAAELLGFGDLSETKTLLIPSFAPDRAEGAPPQFGPAGPRPSSSTSQGLAGPRRVSVVRIRPETGTIHDYMVFVDIDVAQERLGVGKVINCIEAMMVTNDRARFAEIAAQIEQRLAGTVEAYPLIGIATGAARARERIGRDAGLLSGLAALFGVLIVGGYAALNAWERQKEMGVLLAIAARPRHVAWVFLQKMFILGLVGGGIGCAGGIALALHRAPAELVPVIEAVRPDLWGMCALALGLTIALTVLPGLVGVAIAARVDPAETLRGL